MIAPRSGLDREWTAWLSSTDAATVKFEFGSDAFVEGGSALTPEGLGRAARLGLLLRSSPDAKLLLPHADENSIANSRANTLARFLKGRGILADQVIFESVDVQPSDDVAFLLTRRKPSA